jgi:hypothetical protein
MISNLAAVFQTKHLQSALPVLQNTEHPKPVFGTFKRAQESISSLACRYDNPIWRASSPGYIAGGIDSSDSIPGLLKRLQIRALLKVFPQAKTVLCYSIILSSWFNFFQVDRL